MGTFVLNDVSFVVASTDLSDHVRQVNIDYSAETPEDTAMGDTAKSRLPGLLGWKVDVEFNQDYDSAEVNATLFPLAGTTTALQIRPTTDSVGSTNPSFYGSAIMTDYNPLSGKIGETATAKVTFQGTGVLGRAVA